MVYSRQVISISVRRLLKFRVEHRRFQERMRKEKKFRGGTVGAYFLHCDDDGIWCTLIHRRAKNLASFGGDLATPGGSVDKQDFSCYVALCLKKYKNFETENKDGDW